jgi:hypothetical protein
VQQVDLLVGPLPGPVIDRAQGPDDRVTFPQRDTGVGDDPRSITDRLPRTRSSSLALATTKGFSLVVTCCRTSGSGGPALGEPRLGQTEGAGQGLPVDVHHGDEGHRRPQTFGDTFRESVEGGYRYSR